ncbi:unnamed protein product [Mytilus coruscus]|uniref:Uncharacterized protein n=1 Tax=Mytilus coruscus TaxID=42192 RepID=A0A6J8BP82_MYTCO|nr:unnamed protein product [Mytilus coruscus]
MSLQTGITTEGRESDVLRIRCPDTQVVLQQAENHVSYHTGITTAGRESGVLTHRRQRIRCPDTLLQQTDRESGVLTQVLLQQAENYVLTHRYYSRQRIRRVRCPDRYYYSRQRIRCSDTQVLLQQTENQMSLQTGITTEGRESDVLTDRQVGQKIRCPAQKEYTGTAGREQIIRCPDRQVLLQKAENRCTDHRAAENQMSRQTDTGFLLLLQGIRCPTDI